MRRTLLNQDCATEIVRRVNLLHPDTENQWGKMNATEMLRHCNLANKQILEGKMSYQRTEIKKRLLKILSLYLIPRFPRNVKGAERNDTLGKIDRELFEVEKQTFARIVNEFPNHPGPMTLIHPAFGHLTKKDWGIAGWKHMDHHLRQFGV